MGPSKTPCARNYYIIRKVKWQGQTPDYPTPPFYYGLAMNYGTNLGVILPR